MRPTRSVVDGRSLWRLCGTHSGSCQQPRKLFLIVKGQLGTPESSTWQAFSGSRPDAIGSRFSDLTATQLFPDQ
jgi:hypothetical protein